VPAAAAALAWVARDSSKPGRAPPPGVAEAWVVHASPAWSNARGAGAPRGAVARELLSEFLAAAGGAAAGVTEADALVLEAHAWTNA
jgi:predicted NAD/FAD-dependent oxidoreductase